MDPGYFGTEQVTEEDRAYEGSHFSEVRDAIFANPYQEIWGASEAPPLPHLWCDLIECPARDPSFQTSIFFSSGGCKGGRFECGFALGS
jgi:hypothetical protein